MEATDEEIPGRERGRQLRVRLPLAYHYELHRHKLEARKTMARVVREALDMYFQRLNGDAGDAAAAHAPPLAPLPVPARRADTHHPAHRGPRGHP